MRYTDETYALYSELFNDAHTALTKEAVFKTMGKAWQRGKDFLHRGKTLREAQGAATRAEKGMADAATMNEELAFKNKLLQSQGKQHEKQIASGGAREEALQREIQQLGSQPGELGRLRNWRTAGIGAMGVGAVGLPTAYMLGHGSGTEDKTRTRNLAFGAGAAAGLAAPNIVKGVGNVAQGLWRTGLMPEGYGGGGGYGGGY